MMKAVELFEETLEWLHVNYSTFRFFVERDLVWTIQIHLMDLVEKNKLGYQVFNEYPMRPFPGRKRSADLAIVDEHNTVHLAIEFKYEPSHYRKDLLVNRFPVVFWGKDGVGQDIEKIRTFVDSREARAAYAILVDEGRFFRHRPPHSGSQWIDWDNGVSLLVARVTAKTITSVTQVNQKGNEKAIRQHPRISTFVNDESGYLEWLKQNPTGYIINTTKGMGSKYMVLHKTSCSYISRYTRVARQGGFTERQYIKVCALSINDLKQWVQSHGRPDGSFSGVCPCTMSE